MSIDPSRLSHLGQGFVMYFTLKNMLIHLFFILMLLVSLPIIITSSMEIEVFKPENELDKLKKWDYDNSTFGVYDEINMFVSRIQISSLIFVRQEYKFNSKMSAEIFIICNLLGIIFTYFYSVQIRKKLSAMNNSSNMDRKTPGNYTFLLLDVRDPSNKKEV